MGIIARVALAGATGLTAITAMAAPPTATVAAAGDEPVVHFVIDTSGSMGGTKIANAIDAVKQTAAALPDTTALGLRSYSGSCDQSGVAPLVPIGLGNDDAIIAAADGLVAGGGTPTTAALGKGLEDIQAYPTSGDLRLVLLTDGDTGCGISVCDYVASVITGTVELTLYTVGLQVSASAAADLTCAAELTGGNYIEANSPEDLVEALAQAAGGGDRDGDGLPDSWEESGYRAEAGLILVDLPALGANPDRPDVFLRIDAVEGGHLHPDAEQIVIDAFDEQGISLHIMHGPDIDTATADSWKIYDGDTVDQADFRDIYDYWTRTTSWEPSVFHYAASVRWTDTKFRGQAADIPSQMMVLTVCGPRNWRGGCSASVEEQATVLMHELGHQLGLRHGGNDEIAYKPNYLSIMNYAYSVKHAGIPGIGITYSSWGEDDINILDENSISENDGILDYNDTIPDGARVYYYCPNSGRERYGDIGGPIDWNCKNRIEDGRIVANIDFPTSIREGNQAVFTILRPYDDWANLDYSGGGNIGKRLIGWVPGVPTA